MEPGTRWVYREIDEEGEELRVVVTVTSETKEVANGVTARVVRDTVTMDGDVVEDTFDWYAQDSAGTIWYLGEDTAEFEDGRIVSREGSFEAGADGALAGSHHAGRTRRRDGVPAGVPPRARRRTTARCSAWMSRPRFRPDTSTRRC